MAEPAPAEAMPERCVVLVTGASGLVGRALRSVVEAESPGDGALWIWLRSADGDLCDAQAVAKLFDTHKPTHVVHLAAHVGGLFANMARAARTREALRRLTRGAQANNLLFYQRNTDMCAPRDAPRARGARLRAPRNGGGAATCVARVSRRCSCR